MGKYSKYNTRHSDEFLDNKKKQGVPLGIYLGEEYIRDEYYKKNNSIPKDMQNKLNGLSNEGTSADEVYDLRDSINED